MDEEQIFYLYRDTIWRMKNNTDDTWMSFWWWLHSNQNKEAIKIITESLNQEELPHPRLTHDHPARVKTMYSDNKNLRTAVLNYIKSMENKN